MPKAPQQNKIRHLHFRHDDEFAQKLEDLLIARRIFDKSILIRTVVEEAWGRECQKKSKARG
jgi:hypothetical protein